MRGLRLATILACLLSLTGCYQEPPRTQLSEGSVSRPLVWGTVKPYEGKKIAYSGQIIEAQTSMLSFEVDGVLEALSVDIGDAFTTGQVLGELNSRDFLKTQRLAELAQAEVNLQDARRNFERRNALKGTRAISQADIDLAETRRLAAEKTRDALKAALDQERRAVSDRRLTAPFSGRVNRRMVEVGQTLSIGQSVLEVTNSQPFFEIRFNVPERALANFKLSQDVNVIVGREELPLKGSIQEIGFVSSGAVTYPIIVSIPRRQNIYAGMSAKLILTQESNCSGACKLVPITAVQIGDDLRSHVFRLDGDNNIEVIPINVRAATSEGYAVVGDIQVGEKIVTRGVEKLSADLLGEPIALQNAESRPATLDVK